MNRYVPTHFSHVNQYLNGVYYIGSCTPSRAPVTVSKERDPQLASGVSRQVVGFVAHRSGSRADRDRILDALDIPDNCDRLRLRGPAVRREHLLQRSGVPSEAWHGVFSDPTEEAIVDRNQQRPKRLADYSELMESCFQEFFRVLKPGRWMTVEFSNPLERCVAADPERARIRRVRRR